MSNPQSNNKSKGKNNKGSEEVVYFKTLMILVDLKNNDAADISCTAITWHTANTYYTTDAATPDIYPSAHIYNTGDVYYTTYIYYEVDVHYAPNSYYTGDIRQTAGLYHTADIFYKGDIYHAANIILYW